MKKIYALAFASGALLLGSCASDAPEIGGETLDPTQDAIGYLKIEFTGNDNTRATDPNDVTTEESNIENITFIFTATDGTRFTKSLALNADSKLESSDKTSYETDVTEGHTGDKCFVVKLPKMVTGVACVVNGDREGGYNGDLSTDTYAVEKYCKGANVNDKFYMSSARTYNSSGNSVYRTPISVDQVYTKEEDAVDGKAKAIKIYVERYVAKMQLTNNLTLTNGKLDPEDGGNKEQVNATVTFEPEYVTYNNVATKGFTIKRIPTTLTGVSSDLQDWCKGTNFTKIVSAIPANSRKTKSLNDIKTETTMKLPAKGSALTTYEFESVQDAGAEDADWMNPQVIVVGKYTVTDASGNSLAATDGTFYLVGTGDKYDVYKTEGEAIKAMDGDPDTDVLVADGATDETGDQYGYDNPANWKGWTGELKIKGADNNPFRCIKYNGGYGYYTKDIVRTVQSETTYSAIVRNHIYKFGLNKIAGMGVGIIDPTQPLVPVTPPDPTKKNYYLHMSINVLGWEIVNQNLVWGN